MPGRGAQHRRAEREELEEVEHTDAPQPARPGPSPSTGVSPPSTVQNALGAVNKAVGAATAPLGGVTLVGAERAAPDPAADQTSTPNDGAPSAQQAQQLLNYLLSP